MEENSKKYMLIEAIVICVSQGQIIQYSLSWILCWYELFSFYFKISLGKQRNFETTIMSGFCQTNAQKGTHSCNREFGK